MTTTINEMIYNRKEFLELLESAKQSKSFRFLREACTHWLAIYPGDLSVQLNYAKALFHENLIGDSEKALNKILAIDPEYLDAYFFSREIALHKSMKNEKTLNALFALGVSFDDNYNPPLWASLLRELSKEKSIEAEKEEILFRALAEGDDQVLVGIKHLAYMISQKHYVAAQHIAEILEKKWPFCLQIQLLRADCLFKQHQDSMGMNILQQCLSIDSTGQVANRLWGKNHEYSKLWPEKFEVKFDLAVPAEVSANLWGNKLGGGAIAEPEHGHGSDYQEFNAEGFQEEQISDDGWKNRVDLPPEIDEPKNAGEIEKQRYEKRFDQSDSDLEKLSLRLQKHELGDARFPAFVIMSSHKNLTKKYGENTALVIESEMEKLSRIVSKKKNWTSSVFLPDLKASALSCGVKPIDDITPWNIKLAVTDLDKQLASKGVMIGALLIVGGDDVIPFHRLPNPTDDADAEVLSDNPYATVDANYFVPEWQVGRLPGSSEPDSGLILKQIRQSIKFHSAEAKKITWIALIENWFKTNILGNGVATISQRKGKNYGYSAAAWRRSSVATFRPIGDGKDIYISPSINSSAIDKHNVIAAPLSYFNLHGLADAPQWFGQKDANDKKSKEDFPIALSPADLDFSQQLPQIVFSEACYGGFIIGKSESDSMALKFIDRGTTGFVGSTCVSYGSITTPLIGGDLLGNIFWKNIKEGYTLGESLLRAKVELVREMTRRQGFLDGEDQKTVISFVLFGDPLISKQLFVSQSKSLVRSRQVRIVKTICDRDSECVNEKNAYSHAITQAKKFMESNLPGFTNAEIQVSRQNSACEGEKHHCPNSSLGKSIQSNKKSSHTVVVFSKTLDVASYKMNQYARITLDNTGKLVKMAVSR